MTEKKAADLYLWGGKALTLNPKNDIIEDAVIAVRGGRIAEIRSDAKFVPPKGVASVDARGCLLMPGLVNCHTHSGMTLLRGIADDLPLERWLREAIFPLEEKWGRHEFVEWGSRLAFAEMIRSGTTTFADMYYFQEVTAKTAQEVGLRAVGGQAVTEINKIANGKTDVFELFDQYLAAVEGMPLVTPAMAPHSIYGVTETTWKRMVDYAKRRDITVLLHLSETVIEDDDAVKQFGMKPTQFFERIGLWEHKKTLAAHAACVTEPEIEILGRYRVGIGHCPESNLKLGTRVAPIVELRAAGCRVGLGTDGGGEQQ